MPSKDELISEILSACKTAGRDIADKENALQRRINAIRNPTPLRDLTADELRQIDELETAMEVLQASDQQLTVLSIDALENASDLPSLINSVKEVNKNLKSKVEEVRRVARQLQKVADLIKVVDGIAQNLIKLAKLI